MVRRHLSPWAEFSAQRRASARKYNNLRNELGMAFKGAQQDAHEQWAEWDEAMGAESEDTIVTNAAETPLAAAPPDQETVREQGIENLEEIRLHLQYGGVEFDFEGYIASRSGREVVVFFTDISGEEQQAGHVVLQFTIPERQLFSAPFPIGFLKEHCGKQFSLGIVPEHEPFNLSEMGQSLHVQQVEEWR
jgi:hypothetical protein